MLQSARIQIAEMTTKEEVRNSEDKILTDRSPESPMISIEDDDDEELDEYSCQEAMDHAKFGKWQMRLFWLTGLAWTADASKGESRESWALCTYELQWR